MRAYTSGRKRSLAVFLVVALIISLISPSKVQAANEGSGNEYKLVNMAFKNKVGLPYTDNSTGVQATLTRDNDAANLTADYETGSLKTLNWDNKEAYWELAFSTKNFKDLTFDAALQSSDTGPKDFKVAYSTDGRNFTDLTETLTTTNSLISISTVTLPEHANDQDIVIIRVYKASNITINNGIVSSTGVSNINNIVVTGTSIDGRLPELPNPTTEPVTKTVETNPEPIPSIVYPDPITNEDIPEGAITIDQAYGADVSTEVTVIGQIQYRYGKNGREDYTIIEDVIGGQVYGFTIYNALSEYNVGDVVAITGTLSIYGVKQISNPSVTKIKECEPIGPQEVTIAQLLNDKEQYLAEYVLIQDVTLGTYSNSNTLITDSDNNSININQSSAYPDGLEAGSSAKVYAVLSKYNSTYHLRNGKTENSYKKAGYEVDDSITSQLAKWAGTAQIDGNVAYGDLYSDNDFLDKASSISLSTGAKPQYSNTVNGLTEYTLGSIGLPEGGYVQINTSSDRYASLKLDFKLRSSDSGPKYYNILYSADGVNFIKATNLSYTINTTVCVDGVASSTSTPYSNVDNLIATSSWQDYSVTLPDNAANAQNLAIRLQVADGNRRIDGKDSGISDQYSLRLTSIALTGSPIILDDICQIVKAFPEEGTVALGSELTFHSRTPNAVIYYSINGSEFEIYNDANKPILSVLPAVVTTYATADSKIDSVKITYTYTQTQVATVKASPNGGAIRANQAVRLSCEDAGATIYYSIDNGITYKVYTQPITATPPYTIMTYATMDGCSNSEVKTLSYTLHDNENYNIYFGQLHSHTNYSDGAGTPKDAFEYASTKVDDLDFLAITDHSNSFDNDTSCSISDGSASTEWVEGHQLADTYSTESFVGIMGYEMTWSGGAPGHISTFNTNGFLSRNDTGYGNGSSESLANYFASLKTVPDSISQFNHPGTTFGDFYDFGYYDRDIDQLITMIEVGNGEGVVGSSGYYPSYEFYTRALDKGWHLAPTNNQDNHKGNWGSANTARTVILADSLTRDNIYDALRNMRTYATEDSNLSIKYTMNGEIMGTILDETPNQVEIAVSLSDADATDKIGKVEVIVNGGLSVASKVISANHGDVTFTLSPDYSYYYIRVTEGDGDIAVTAPVWIGEVDAAGISSVSTSSAMQIQDESVDITTEIYNSNETDFNISSITFEVDGRTVKTLEGDELTAAGLDKVVSHSTKTYTFDFTYSGVGSATVTVKVNASMNDVNKVYSGKVELNYVPRTMISKVIIDGTHFNDYVSGYYDGSVTTLARLASNYYEEVITKTDTITASDLADCALLVISSPAKQSGTNSSNVAYSPTTFDDAFIQLVADYVKNGGKVVLCGIADYKDCATVQTSTEMNKLLEAMGATTRFNSDELYDDINYSNQNYRLYFDDYNKSSKYLNGLVDGMKYSCYSGCGILLDGTSVAAGKAEALVYGHDTTYSIDSKKLDSNYIEQEKGTIVALAHETIGEKGGAIWAGGTVFLSNYEIDEEIIQNAEALSSSNTLITSNILKECKKTVPTPVIDPDPSVSDNSNPKEPAKDEPNKDEPNRDEPNKDNKDDSAVKDIAAKGKTYIVKGIKYKVTDNKTDGTGTVTVVGAQKKTITSLTLKKTVEILGNKYRINTIGDKAFKGYKKLKTVKLGENIVKIGTDAFRDCPKLKTVTIQSKNLTTIGKYAFYKCKVLTSITIKSSKLSSKKIGKNAFKGINKKCKFDVPNKKKASYKKMFQKKGANKKVSVK